MEANDAVNAPVHYIRNGVECRDIARAMASGAPVSNHAAHLWESAFEYLFRWPYKNGVEDLLKCRRNIDDLIKEITEKN